MKYLVLKQLGVDRKIKIDSTAPKNDQSISISRQFPSSQAKKTRRFRSAFTTEQIQYLEREFKKFPYIGSGNRKEVSSVLKIPERAVKIWFQNRRMKEKKEVHNKEADEELKKIIVTGPGPSSTKSFNHQSHISQPYVCQPKSKTIYPDPSITKASIKHFSSNKKVNESSKFILDKQRIMMKNFDNRNYTETNNTRVVNKVAPASRQLNSKAYAPMKMLQNKNICITKVPLAQELPVNPKFEHGKKLGNSNITSDPQSCPQVQPRFYQINPNQDQRFMPHVQPLPQPPPFTPGNIVWKAVNMMPVLPGIGNPPQVHNSFSLMQPIPKEDCKCNCNAYNSSQDMSSLMQIDGLHHLQPQYILAMPYNHNFDRI